MHLADYIFEQLLEAKKRIKELEGQVNKLVTVALNNTHVPAKRGRGRPRKVTK